MTRLWADMDVCDTIYIEGGPGTEIPAAPPASRSSGLRRARVLGLVSGTGPPLSPELPELLFVGARELFTKETGKGDFRVLFHVLPLLTVEIPVAQPGGDQALATLAIEFLLHPIRIRLGEHRLECHPHPGEHGKLVIAQVVERVGKGVDRTQIRGI